MNRATRQSPDVSRHRISVPASYAGLKDLFDSCRQFAGRYGINDAVRQDMYIAIEELVSNVIRHGAVPGIRPRVTVSVTLTPRVLCVTVADNASAFNPLLIPPPDLNTPLEERPLGGLGIHFVKTLMDDVRYRRQRNRNHVRLTKRLRPTGPTGPTGPTEPTEPTEPTGPTGPTGPVLS